MARKNLLANITEEKLTGVNSLAEGVAMLKTPPLAFAGRGALGAVTRTIDDLAARAEAARDIEARLTAGEVVVDLDPIAIDASFIADRLDHDDGEFQRLLEAIRDRGQDSPILVRPHPVTAGRYQVAFGHRRLRAARHLGRQVRAVVKTLSDRELVLAQGQENSARANLSFIERALFAQCMEVGGYDRDTIMSALSVDKTTVSRMISVTTKISTSVITKIGPAPATGRDRWIELATAFQNAGAVGNIDSVISANSFLEAASDDRFNLIFDFCQQLLGTQVSAGTASKASARKASTAYWSTENGTRVAKITTSNLAFVLAIDKRIAPKFGDFLLSQLDRLYATYSNQPKVD